MASERYVLVVDDDEDARRILVRIMQNLGITARTAADGRQALDIIKQAAPSLIMLDLMMPAMNGFEVLFHLKAKPETRYIPVVVLSAITQDDYLKLPGVDRVIRKANMRVADVQLIVSELVKDLARATSAPQPGSADLERLTRLSNDASNGTIKTDGGPLVP